MVGALLEISELALLSLTVLLLTINVVWLRMPPPVSLAALPRTVLLVRVRVPRFAIPPPTIQSCAPSRWAHAQN